MHRSFLARALGALVLVLVAAGCGPTASAGSLAAPSVAAAAIATPRPTATATTSPTAAVASPTPTTATATTFDTTTLGANFDLPLTITLPPDWRALPPPDFGPAGAFGFVHTGHPASDDSQWWGPGMYLVNGASVADPAAVGKPVAGGDKKLPWPSSYVDYVASLPGVTVVEAPRRVKIGGVKGRQIVVEVPPMHPTVFLKGDTMWIGGGAAGFDLAGTREVIELTVNGKRLLFDYGDSSEQFPARRPEVDAIFRSIQFDPAG